MNGKNKRILGGILSAAMLTSTAAPVFAADSIETVDAPVNLEIPAAATTYSSISVIWDKPEDYKNITGYNVYIDGTKTAKTEANETYYTAENLTPNSQHTFTVTALTGETESIASNEVTAKTDVKGAVRDVTDAAYGAKGDGTTNDTAAIQAAIDACEDNDIVLLPEGKTFLSGALDLKSNMTFEVNGTLAGIQTPSEYEKKGDTSTYEGGTTSTGSVYTAEAEKRLIWSRIEGWEQYCYRSLINVGSLTKGTNYGETDIYSVSNVKIIGTGEITGSNSDYRTQYAPISGQASYLAQEEGNSAETFYDLAASNENGVTTNNIRSRIRSRLVNISNAQNVYMKGVTVSRPPMWTVHMIYSDNITTNGVTFNTTGYRNGDGWDPDSSSNCTIYDCDFKTGDDCVAIKSGKNPEGNQINRPAENIKVIGCTSNGGLGLAVGSEMSGGVDGVLVRDCELSNTRYGVELKANRVRGGYIRDFTVEDSTIDQVLIHSVTYNADGTPADTPPIFSDIHFKNTNIISRDGYDKKWLTTGITIDGFDNDDNTDDNYIQNVTFEDITLGTDENIDQTISLKRSKNISFYNVFQYDGNEPVYSESSTSNITVDVADNNAPSAPTGLLTNELENPLNAENPTFGWIVNDKDKDEVQTAYEIVITDEVTGEKVWDSGKVKSSEQSYVGMTEGVPIDDNPDDGDVMPITFGYSMQNNKLTGVDAYRNDKVGAATVFIASYDSLGKLARLISKPLEAGEADTEKNYTLSEDEVVELLQGGLIKLFAWEQGSEGTTMKPLSDAEKIDGKSSGAAHSSSSFENIDSLEAAHPYSWKVRTWDKYNEVSPYSESAYFTTGLSESEWNEADWISDGTTGAEKAEGTYNHYWYVRTNKALTKTVSKATAYFAGVHDYDLYVNGTEIGRGQSFDYASETRYQGWDITDAVKSNADSVSVGALVRTYGGGQGRAPGNAAFIGYVKLYYTDGTSDVIATNTDDWYVSKTTPYKEINTSSASGTRNGEGDFVEVYTASNAQNFTDPDFDASGWIAASERVSGTEAIYKGKVIDDGIITDTPIAELSKVTAYEAIPVSIETLSDGTTIADFGVVIPARPEITFKNGTADRSVTIQGGYILNTDGKINTSANATQQTAMTWTYIEKDGEQTYNAWDHLGFRYLQIPSCGETFTKDTLKAKVVHTSVPENRQSTFVTSNETLNNVYMLMQRSSLYGIQNEFVDTPTREKGQFTDDARNISEASMATQFEREASRKAIMQFLASEDRFWTDENGDLLGRVNSVYPNVEGGRDIPEYSVNIPQWIWNYYMQTGDKATLEYAYPYMKATADYITGYTSSLSGLVEKLGGGDTNPNDYQYGIVDWPAEGRFGYDWKNCKNGAFATVNMLSKHAYDVIALAAAEIGEDADKTDMENRSNALKTAINNKMKNSDGLYVDGTTSSGTQSTHISQHANSYALAFDIVEEANKDTVAEYVASQGMKQGPMTADILAKGLFNGGQNGAALKLFVNENDYGWANQFKQGGTFTWEAWNADGSSSNYSQSHAWGATAASDILRNFAGVQILEPGAGKIKIAPVYVDLASLNATVQTERGGVGVKYERDDTKYEITLTIPANMTAEVELPDVGDGIYKYRSKIGDAVANNLTLGSGTYKYVFDGEITPPETLELEEPVQYDSETYDFSTLGSEEFSSTYKGDKVFNDYITLHFNDDYSNISSGGNGFDLYNSTGAYIEFTPPSDGKISLNTRVRSGGLYMSTDTVRSSDEQLLSSSVTSSLTDIGSFNVEGGKTYCIYNKGGDQSKNPISVKSITYFYPKEPLIGIVGSVDTDSGVCTWTIRDGSANNTYTDENDYADMIVSLGSGDSMSESDGTINYSNASVRETNDTSGMANAEQSKRYIQLTPHVNGTMSVSITFTDAASQNNNRIHYMDFESGSVDLASCAKNENIMTGGTVGKNTLKTYTLDMKAGHTYVLYTYQRGSIISGLSYKYLQ